MNSSNVSLSKWKKLCRKYNLKKKLRHEKITRYDLIMLNAKMEEIEREDTVSQRSSQSIRKTSTESWTTEEIDIANSKVIEWCFL